MGRIRPHIPENRAHMGLSEFISKYEFDGKQVSYYIKIMLEYSKPDAIKKVESAIQIMLGSIHEIFNLETISKEINVSKYYLIRIFKEVTGLTPGLFFRKLKVLHIDKYLQENTDIPLTDLAYQYGYSSSSVLTREFQRFIGSSPKKCRKLFQDQKSNILQKQRNIMQASDYI